SFLAGKKRPKLKHYIAEALRRAGRPMGPKEVAEHVKTLGYQPRMKHERSFYNTVFQALQRYDIFERKHRKYQLAERARDKGAATSVTPKETSRIRDHISKVLGESDKPLTPREIVTKLQVSGLLDSKRTFEQDEQHIRSTLRKYTGRNGDFDESG